MIDHAPRPVLIGTWKAARWAVRFYEKHDFCLVDGHEKNRLLRHYWDIPDQQVETSVVNILRITITCTPSCIRYGETQSVVMISFRPVV